MPLRADQVQRLTAKFSGLIVTESCTVIDCTFGKDVVLSDGDEIYMSTLGDRTYVANRTSICWTDIGKFCSVGPNTFVGMAAHPARDFVSTHPIFYLALPQRNLTWSDKNYFDGAPRTTVGHDVWIGGNVSIKSGVTIGHGAIIGAGAVVTKDVTPYAVMAGVPAKKIRDRFTASQIEQLLRLEWWNKPESWLRENLRDFHDIETFLKRAAH
jgi:acetyltransferase-like isoleucine patch superfamily enzyme